MADQNCFNIIGKFGFKVDYIYAVIVGDYRYLGLRSQEQECIGTSSRAPTTGIPPGEARAPAARLTGY